MRLPVVDTVLQDLHYAVRGLWARPGFALVAVFTLALGIGANTAIYSVVDATLLRTLPFRDPDRLMQVSIQAPARFSLPGQRTHPWSVPKYETFRQLERVFEDSSLYRAREQTLAGLDGAERIRTEQVSTSYFPVLGISTILGRAFLPEEESTPGTHMVAVLGEGAWKRYFGGDRSVLGRSVRLDGKSFTVVGVVGGDFKGLTGTAEIWTPFMADIGDELTQRWSHSFDAVARLKPGVTPEAAKAEVAVIGRQIDKAHPLPVPGAGEWGAVATLLQEDRLDAGLRRSVLVLFGASAFLLLIACVNIANLLLARAGARRTEIAVRQSVGAGRARLVRLLLAESLVLSVAGAVSGLLVARALLGFLAAVDPAAGAVFGRRLAGLSLIGFSSVHLDGRVLLFTAGLTIATALVFGLMPALAASRASLVETLKGSSHSSGGRGFWAGRNLLITGQIALALMLLTGAGLMIKSFAGLVAISSGVDPAHILTVRVAEPSQRAAGKAAPSSNVLVGLEARAAAVPGVVAAGLGTCHPFAGACSSTAIWFRDRPPVPQGTEPPIDTLWASPNLAKALRIPLIAGRWFTDADRQGAPKVVVITQAAARAYFPNENPIGRIVAVGQGGFGDRAEIVGVAGDIRYGQVHQPPKPAVYLPVLQSSRSEMMLFVRAEGDPGALAGALRREAGQFDKNLPLSDVLTLSRRMGQATARARFGAALLAVFAAIALVLAAAGIYGVMSYAVSQRTREIGIRVAVGAVPGDVLRLILSRGALLTAAGIALGAAGALAAGRVLETLLFEVTPADPATHIAVAATLGTVALLASLAPALRATRIDVIRALRSE